MTTTELAVIGDEVVDACAPWSAIVRRGQTLQIIDLHGNQAVDTLFYGVSRRPRRSRAALQRAGHRRRAAQHLPDHRIGAAGRRRHALMTIVADEVGNHDTIAGACSKESNTLRYGHHTVHQHACAENFLAEAPSGGWASATSCRTSTSS